MKYLGKIGWGSICMLAGLVLIIVLAACGIPGRLDVPPVKLWMAGAGALGLLSGFTTGLSNQPGSGTEFVKFLGAGVLVPMLGALAALLGKTEEVTENSKYESTQLIEKTIKTVTSFSDGSLHPLAVLGSFFVVFGVLAILGIVGGVLLREAGLPGIMAGEKQA